MQLGPFQPLGDEPLDERLNGGVICLGNAIGANKPVPLYDLGISENSGALRFLLKQVSRLKNLLRRNGLWKAIYDRNGPVLLILLFGLASFANRGFNGIGASGNFNVVCFRACDCEHERGSISKIAKESDGARALW